VQDHQSGAFNRLTAQGHYLFGRMDGVQSVEALWQDACQRFPDDPPSQSDVIHLLSQLYQGDLITADTTPDMEELAARAKRQAWRKWTSRVKNPLAMRLPLFDPDPFLQRTEWLVAPVFTRLAAVLWLCLMAVAIWLAATNWQDLTATASDTALLGGNLLLMSLIYPIIKLLHELGHGYATRHWGGEVREVGFLILLFVPVPYVDASQSLAFASKWQRAGVAAAGIVVELTLAAVALIFWLNAEPGLAREAAFNILLIGSVSTLVFNGNPLLRFDGYYILSDLIEIPNLGLQANRYFWHLVQRHLLKIRHLADPPRDLGERIWLLAYAVLSFIYRTLIVVAIALYIAGWFGTVGLLLAIFALFTALVWPVLKGGWFLARSPLLMRLRQRAVLVSLGAVALLMLVLFAVPVPYVTVANGVFWPDARSILRAEAEGFISEVLVPPGAAVGAGQPVLRLEDPTLESRIEVASSDVQQLELEAGAVRMTDRVHALMLDQQLIYARQRLADLQGIAARLKLNSPAAGHVHLSGDRADLPGRLVRKGEALGYVWPVAAPVLRVAVHQAEAELVRTRTVAVDFVLKRDRRHRASARISAWVPDSTLDLPSKALSTDADGDIVPDPTDPSGMTALQSLYLFEVTPDQPVRQPLIGERALVRFDHGAEPYGWRILRSLRQIFLRRLDP
jgi:putative peptide zinc metalloprotease protein